MTTSRPRIVRTPLFPTYSEVSALLKVFQHYRKAQVLSLIKALHNQVGTVKNNVDWSNPDQWIGEKLHGDDRQLATDIWQQSQRKVNPRHIYGAYLFIAGFDLLDNHSNGLWQLTAAGQGFLDNQPDVVRQLDEAEGLPQLLAILATCSPARRRDLLEEWSEFLLENSNYKTPSTFKDTLSRRLGNLVERGYVSREGNSYSITSKGVDYAAPQGIQRTPAAHHSVANAVKAYNDTQMAALRSQLESMDPYRFEALIKDLLEAMDYENVEVTKQSGDKGVDVTANFQFGITEIKEVVQVKRHRGNLGRPVLDQLRGVLPLHGALRGTIITIGGFAKGCKDVALFPGAAPITLIDGDKLIELLVKHNVAVKQKKLTLIEIDDSYFLDEPETSITE
ncbi:restriction endonuclease [Pseudomonas sp.]|uniref:restriction endonuclease n=1 Tax=Pseudomonas sp. TaxID=306 RepID=UPI003CC6A913